MTPPKGKKWPAPPARPSDRAGTVSAPQELGESLLAFIPVELAENLVAFVSGLQSGNGQIILNLHKREADGPAMVETCMFQEHWRRPKSPYKKMQEIMSPGAFSPEAMRKLEGE